MRDTSRHNHGMSIASLCARDRLIAAANEGTFSNRNNRGSGAAVADANSATNGTSHGNVACAGFRNDFDCASNTTVAVAVGNFGVGQKGHKMKLKHLMFAAAVTVTATQAQAQGFSDTWGGVRDGWSVSNPGAPSNAARNVNKIIVNAGHFDVWDFGTNFFNVDVLFSNANEPANNSGGGSTEFYAVYRAQLSPDKIFGINTKMGPLTGINLEVGGDAEAEDTAFAPDKKAVVVGPNFNFGLGAGFLNIGVHLYHEWNNNGFSSCPTNCGKGGAVNFDSTGEFEFVWLYSLKGLIGIPLDFKGFTNVVLPKGKDGFGGQTKTEVLARPTLSLDIGSMWFNKPHKPDIYFMVELWENKFGNDHTKVSGAEEISPMIGIEYHF